MPTKVVAVGYPCTLTQNVVFALIPKTCRLLSTAAIEGSPDGTTWIALTGANTIGADTAAAFVRCTTASPTIICTTYSG